jgi:hypothetical protein
VTGRSKRILIGCGIGCGSLILIVIVVAVAFAAWIRGKGELLEPQRLLGAETTGYVEWTLRLEDPGTEGFVQLLIDALNAEREGRAQRMPEWLRQLIVQRQNRNADEEIRQLFPVVLAWTMAPGDAADRDEMLFTVSPTGLGNRLVFVDWLVGFAAGWSDQGFVEGYRDEKIFRMPAEEGRSQTFFLRAGTVFFTTDVDAAKLAVDRLQQDDRALRQPGPLDPVFDQTSTEQTLRGALSNERGEAARVWKEVSGGAGSGWTEGLRSVALEGGLREEGSFVAAFRFRGADRAWAEARAEELREAMESLFSESHLELRVRAETEGDTVEVEVRLEDVIGSLQRWFDEQERRSGVRINL